MPKRHGSFRPEEKSPIFFLFGITSILAELRASTLRTIYPQPHRKGPSAIQETEFHLQYVARSLVHSLDVFQRRLGELTRWYNTRGFSAPKTFLCTFFQLEASIAASSIFHFLSLLTDDVAKTILLALGVTPTPDNVDDISFGALVRKVERGRIGLPLGLRRVFSELNDQNSWWNLGFEYGKGIRQRLVHYTDVIQITASRESTAKRFRTTVFLHAVSGRVPVRNFEAEIAKILRSLCDWLDKVERALNDELTKRACAEGIQWSPRRDCPRIPIPVEVTTKWRVIPRVNFLYLPMCEGSNPLKARIRIDVRKSSFRAKDEKGVQS